MTELKTIINGDELGLLNDALDTWHEAQRAANPVE